MQACKATLTPTWTSAPRCSTTDCPCTKRRVTAQIRHYGLFLLCRAPKVEAELARILGTSAISQTFNLDQVFRQMFINVIEGSKPKPKPKFKSKSHSPSTAKEQSGKRGLDGPSDGTPATKDEGVVDPPPRKKPLLKLQSPKKEKKLRPRNRELPPVAHPNAANPLAGRLGCIMAAVVQGRKGAAKKVIQVRPVAVLSEAFVRVEDAWPRDATTPSYWELRNTSLVDYLGLQHSAADFQEGDLVYSLFKLDAGMSSEFYGGRVTAVAADTVTVQFEDADQQMVRYDQLLRLADFGANHGLKIPTFEIN